MDLAEITIRKTKEIYVGTRIVIGTLLRDPYYIESSEIPKGAVDSTP